MGKVIVLDRTTKNPISFMGYTAGYCWNADIEDEDKNFKRGLNCIESGHHRVMEYPQIYLEIDGYSARVIREWSRHIGGLPTYLQASTRYVDYSNFDCVIPKSIESDVKTRWIYCDTMEEIAKNVEKLIKLGVPKEDAAMLLPLGMQTKIIWRGNLRTLYDMSRVRLCNRAYWEYRELLKEVLLRLSVYDDEWNFLINEAKIFVPKCDDYGFCNEKNGCGRKPRRVE